ncbi:MAG: phosphotransferase [candidate division Zixibacteria bacterium]|nr:phosphotransferase [candidate division Zixibacteria bacterium]
MNCPRCAGGAFMFKEKLAKSMLPAGLYIASLMRAHKSSISAGLPDGIDEDHFQDLCFGRFGKMPVNVFNQPLSGWKATGAYRLYISFGRLRYRSMIYKAALYSEENTPALNGLPVSPGPPEYYIYKYAHDDLQRYLPDIFDCREIIPNIHYRYILEDLKPKYRIAQGVDDLMLCVKELFPLHKALNNGCVQILKENALKFDNAYRTRLSEYVKINLEEYVKEIRDDNVQVVLGDWDKIEKSLVDETVFDQLSAGLIHGDYNRTNIHISGGKAPKIKLVDWEWTGFGLPHADLASLLKGQKPEIEKRALKLYAEMDNTLDYKEHSDAYNWCQLERGLLDAGFLARHHLNSRGKVEWIPAYISGAMRRVIFNYRNIEK